MKCFLVYSFISILTFYVAPVNANNSYTSTIRGTVVDAVTGFPLTGATVVLTHSSPPRGATTDQNGLFKIADIPVGRQSLEISFLGYESQFIGNLLVTSGKETVINVQLEESPLTVEEIVVKANKRKDGTINELVQVSGRTFSVEETERFAGSLGDPARMVANYAGVMTQNDSRNDIIIRGNSPMGVLWRLEGIEIPNPNHFGALGTTGGPVSMINNNLLTNSDFLTGAFPAEYGNATAGAFDLNLRSGNNQETEFTGQVGFNGFELGAEGPVKKNPNGVNSSYLANFRYSTLEVMSELGFVSGTGEAVPRYKDFTFLLDVPGTKFGRFKIFGLWGTSSIELGRELSDTSENSYNSVNTATDFGSNLIVTGLQHTYFINKALRLKSTISYQTTNATADLDSVNRREKTYKPWIRSYQQENKLSVTTQIRHKINSKNNYSVGFIADIMEINYLDSIYDTDYQRFLTTADVKGDMNMLRAYTQWQHKFSNTLTGYAGINFQYFSLNDEFSVEPRLSLNWQFSERQSVALGFGVHSQLQPNVVYVYQSYDSVNNNYYKTNEDVKFTKSNHFVLGYNYLIGANLRFKFESYYQQLYNVPVSGSSPEFSMLNAGADFGIPREENLINEGTGTNYGVEFTIERFLSSGFYALFTTSLFESKYKGYDGIERNTAFNGNYVFNLLSGYEFKLGAKGMLTFDVKTVWAGGKRYVPIDIEKSLNAGEEERDWSNAYKNKYDDYFRTDLRIGFKTNGKHIWQEWAIDLQNITGFKSIFMEGFDPQDGEVYTVYQQGFLPMFLYRIHF